MDIKKGAVKTFIELVKIDSPSGEEGEVCGYIQKRLNRLGIKSTLDKAGNLFAKVNGVGEPLVVCTHMDTVEPGRNIKPVIKNGVIKSDGTTILGADNKVAVAAVLEAVENVLPEKRRSLEMIFSVREETDGGINEFDFSKLRAKVGIIADRASVLGNIVIASPWIVNVEISLKGKSAHAGMPEKGINALTAAAYAINKLHWGRIYKDTTANIGIIEGGFAMNTIPETVKLTGEVRSFNKASLDKALGILKKVFEETAKKHQVKIDIKTKVYCSGYNYKKSDKAIGEIVAVFEKLKIKPSYEVSFGGSDANSFSVYGIQVVNIADGAKDPHTLKESVKVKDLEKLKDIFIEYISAS